MRKRYILGLLILVISAGVVGVGALQKTRSDLASSAIKSHNSTTPVNSSYRLNLLSGVTYPVNKAIPLRFTINYRNRTFKAFNSSDEGTLMVYVIRKDRTNFQRIHPQYDGSMGTFTIPNFQVPTDGPYRLFTQFTAANAPKTSDGNKMQSAPYVDVRAGDMSKYTATPQTSEKLASSADGFDTSFFFSSDDSPGSKPITYFNAAEPSSIAISINKNGAPYKNLQDYRGSMGRVAAFGPNLDLVTANSEPTDTSHQSGLVLSTLIFPRPGLYKMFLQTQAANLVSTFDYNVIVKAIANTNQSRGRAQ